MQEITRRGFMSMAGSIAAGLALLLSSPEPSSFTSSARAEEPKKSAPLVEILSPEYSGPKTFASFKSKLSSRFSVNPNNGAIYFANKSGTYSSYGNAESVYELSDGKIRKRFPGAGDAWGSRQLTLHATNSMDEILIYGATYLGEDIKIFDLKTGKEKFSEEQNFGNLSYDFRRGRVKQIITNPSDNKFYLGVTHNNRDPDTIDCIDVKTKSIKEGVIRDLSVLDNICFDSSGNLYHTRGGSISVIKANGEKDKLKIKDPDKVLDPENLTTCHMIYDSVSKRLILGGSVKIPNTNKPNYEPDYILAVDRTSGNLFPIMRAGLYVRGLDLDNKGNIYFSYEESGETRIAKIARK